MTRARPARRPTSGWPTTMPTPMRTPMRTARPTAMRTALLAALSVLMLVGCTAAHPGAPAASSTSHGTARGKAAFKAGVRVNFQGPGAVVNVGPGGGGPRARGFIIIGGPGGPGGGAVIGVPDFGPSGSGSRPQISLLPIPPANSGQTVALPLDSYEQIATQEQNALTAASQQLTQQCMQAKGFSYSIAAPAGAGVAALLSIEVNGYGVASLAQAQTYGYGQNSGSAGGGPGGGPGGPGTFIQVLSQHASAWTSALLGFVPGAPASASHEGCLQETNDELYGSLNGNSNPDPVPGITIQAAQWTQSDPRIVAVQREWSSCMARRGFTYKTPAQAEQHNWPNTPTPVEIATAVADVRCKSATNLVNTWLTVEAAYQQALISQNLTGLAQLQTSFGALLRRAEVLLQFTAFGEIGGTNGRPPIIRSPP